MMNVNLGGAKSWGKFTKSIQKAWRVMDIAPASDIPYDLNSGKLVPLCDMVVGNYYTSHTLEHVRPEYVRFVFSELHRTMVPGGRIRIVVPDFKQACKWYLADDPMLHNKQGPASHKHTPPTPLGRLMCWAYSPDRKHSHGHHMAYDYETLEYLLQQAGFKDVREWRFRVSGSAVFIALDMPRYERFSLYVEAVA